jgi:hypothetical protein
MTSRLLTAAVAVLSLVTAAAPAMDASAQGRHGGFNGGHGNVGRSFNAGRGFNGGRGFNSGYRGYHGGYGDRGYGAGALIGGLALGAALGYYSGHPYYCRNHRHWRWSPYYQRYVYYNGGYC